MEPDIFRYVLNIILSAELSSNISFKTILQIIIIIVVVVVLFLLLLGTVPFFATTGSWLFYGICAISRINSSGNLILDTINYEKVLQQSMNDLLCITSKCEEAKSCTLHFETSLLIAIKSYLGGGGGGGVRIVALYMPHGQLWDRTVLQTICLPRLFCRLRTVLLSMTKLASSAHVLEEKCTIHIGY